MVPLLASLVHHVSETLPFLWRFWFIIQAKHGRYLAMPVPSTIPGGSKKTKPPPNKHSIYVLNYITSSYTENYACDHTWFNIDHLMLTA